MIDWSDLQPKENLTSLVNFVIVILNEEVQLGNITELQQKDILELFNRASKKIFTHYPEYQREVSSMTELKIKTLSMKLAEKDEQLAEKDEQLAAYKTELADKEAIIAELKKQLTALR